MEKKIKKIQKTLFLTNFGSFYPFLGKTEFFFKILFKPAFLILTKYHCAKFQKRLMSGFQATLASDGQTDRQA